MATWQEITMGTAATASSNNPVAIGTAASAGSNSACSRDDHVHILGADCIANGTLIADDAVNAEHIGALTAAVDFNGNQGQNFVVHTASSPPAAVVGKIYYDAEDNKIYVCTAAP